MELTDQIVIGLTRGTPRGVGRGACLVGARYPSTTDPQNLPALSLSTSTAGTPSPCVSLELAGVPKSPPAKTSRHGGGKAENTNGSATGSLPSLWLVAAYTPTGHSFPLLPRRPATISGCLRL
jgi:hypothetical protein